MSNAESLTPELLDLMEHEKVIEQGIATFLDVGWALLAIRDGRKYRAARYDTFESYCRDRWSLSRPHAYQLIHAAELAPALSSIEDIPAPQSESQLRPLASLRDQPAKAAEVWAAAVEDAGGQQPTAAQVERAVARQRGVPLPVARPDLDGQGTAHPARYPRAVLPMFAELLADARHILDPFAGTGERLAELAELMPAARFVGIELESEWAAITPQLVQVGDATALPFDDGTFDAIVTSPAYGNRLADQYDAYDPQARRTYSIDLGRRLTANNAGAMQWGDRYRDLHRAAWTEARRVLAPSGRLVLMVKDHIRDGKWRDVAGWHVAELCRLGLEVVAVRPIATGSLPQADNGTIRVGAELVIALEKP